MTAHPKVGKGRLTHHEIDLIRQTRGRSMLLFITDRCPVGCAHCSVSSRSDSPTIANFSLFEQIVDWICGQRNIEVVGISGGEPFVERRGLLLASRRLAAVGKRLVIFTSGVWARAPTPEWIREILSTCASIYLSTDAFHVRSVSDSDFVRAARAIVSAGVWLIVQTVDHDNAAQRVERLLKEAFGEEWRAFAETNLVAPLTSGRGGDVFSRPQRVAGKDFKACPLARCPMVRYDGLATACCNESVIMGGGPRRLRQPTRSANELDTAVRDFHNDPLLRVIGDIGLGILTQHPKLKDLANQNYSMNCELCWKIMERFPDRENPDRLVNAIGALEAEV